MRWKKSVNGRGVALLLIMGAMLAGCGGTNAGNAADAGSARNQTVASPGPKDAAGGGSETRIIHHQAGETEISGQPQRIVALEFSFVDALWQLGITPVGIAQENEDDVDGLVGKKIEFTPVGTRKQPSLETISSLKPDLIIADLNRHKAIYDELSKIAPTIVLKSRNSSYAENLESFKNIAEAVGKQQEGEKILADHSKKIKALEAQVSKDESRKVLLGVFRADSLSAHGAASFDGELLKNAGIPNALTDAPEAQVNITLEQLSELNPDVIFMVEADKKLIEEWNSNPLWSNISAVKNGAVYEVNRALWTRYRGLGSAERILQEAIGILYPNNGGSSS